jgi:hypothetical protein
MAISDRMQEAVGTAEDVPIVVATYEQELRSPLIVTTASASDVDVEAPSDEGVGPTHTSELVEDTSSALTTLDNNNTTTTVSNTHNDNNGGEDIQVTAQLVVQETRTITTTRRQRPRPSPSKLLEVWMWMASIFNITMSALLFSLVATSDLSMLGVVGGTLVLMNELCLLCAYRRNNYKRIKFCSIVTAIMMIIVVSPILFGPVSVFVIPILFCILALVVFLWYLIAGRRSRASADPADETN